MVTLVISLEKRLTAGSREMDRLRDRKWLTAGSREMDRLRDHVKDRCRTEVVAA